MQFRIEFIKSRPDHSYVLARQLVQSDFALSESPTLGGAAIVRAVTHPRAIKPDGSHDYSLFAFNFVSVSDASRFSVGQVVELVP